MQEEVIEKTDYEWHIAVSKSISLACKNKSFLWPYKN